MNGWIWLDIQEQFSDNVIMIRGIKMSNYSEKLIRVKEIGISKGLSGEVLEVYSQYVLERFPHAGESYYEQWAERFRDKGEWTRSDLEGQRLLKRISEHLYGHLKEGHAGGRKH